MPREQLLWEHSRLRQGRAGNHHQEDCARPLDGVKANVGILQAEPFPGFFEETGDEEEDDDEEAGE